jgi:LmbE family N-acetylglucosaminyl deacetylase
LPPEVAVKLSRPTASVFVPDGKPLAEACARVTHLGVGAHQDDLEFMALHGIAECFQRDDRWFAGVVCTDGAGSPRGGKFATVSGGELRATRREEQNRAAGLGEFALMAQLDFPSVTISGGVNGELAADLREILTATRPRVVYTHNPADKHETHLAVLVALLAALRALPADGQPEAVYGCEVWRGLDWLPDDEKIVHDLTGSGALADALNGVFTSQIAAGKRYDLAVSGRRRTNATFLDSRAIDRCEAAAFAMNLTPLMVNPTLDVADFTVSAIEHFKREVVEKLNRQLGR